MRPFSKIAQRPPIVTTQGPLLSGRRVLVHPSGMVFVRTEPMPHGFRPRHCAGADTHPSNCLHLHPGDEACGCGQAVLPPDGGAIVLQLRPHNAGGNAPVPFIRHARDLCHEVSSFAGLAGSAGAGQ